MLKKCALDYPLNQEQKKEFTNIFSFPLSSFQKWAIDAIIGGDNVLVTAHTGSGKSVPFEFAVQYFCLTK